jgi:hypothetical protein
VTLLVPLGSGKMVALLAMSDSGYMLVPLCTKEGLMERGIYVADRD